MQFDVVNSENKKVGSVDVSDDVFGGRVNGDLIWESVVHTNAAERRGTHKAKNRPRTRWLDPQPALAAWRDGVSAPAA
jgi:ribosomal protein L4